MMTIFFILSFAFAQQTPWEVLNEKNIPAPPAQEGIVQLPLELYVEASSKWTRPQIIEGHIAKSSKILSQCGIVIGKVNVQFIRLSPALIAALNEQNPYKGPSELALVENLATPVAKVTGFLYAQSVPRTASAFNENSVRRLSIGSVNAAPLVNTFNITEHFAIERPGRDYHHSYSTFAHELAHIIGNMGHVDIVGNLMSTRENRNSKTGDLTAEQCQAMKSFALLLDPNKVDDTPTEELQGETESQALSQ